VRVCVCLFLCGGGIRGPNNQMQGSIKVGVRGEISRESHPSKSPGDGIKPQLVGIK
jgi:hypothetical protein